MIERVLQSRVSLLQGSHASVYPTIYLGYFLSVEEVEVWDDLENEHDLDMFNEEDTSNSNLHPTPHSTLVLWLVYLIAQLQKKHYVPNSAVSVLLKVLSIVFVILSKIHPDLSDISELFPTTIYSMQKLLNLKAHTFLKYVSCPDCHALYRYADCIESSG